MQPPLRRTSPCTLTALSPILCPRSVSSSCSSCSPSCLLFRSLPLSLRTLFILLVALRPLPQLFVHPTPGTLSVRSLLSAGTMPTTRATGTTSFRLRPPLRALPLRSLHPSQWHLPSPIHFPRRHHPRSRPHLLF